jgi:hypothetical protein
LTPADIAPVVTAAPVSFLLGVFVGLWVSSFYRIVRRANGTKREAEKETPE